MKSNYESENDLKLFFVQTDNKFPEFFDTKEIKQAGSEFTWGVRREGLDLVSISYSE